MINPGRGGWRPPLILAGLMAFCVLSLLLLRHDQNVKQTFRREFPVFGIPLKVEITGSQSDCLLAMLEIEQDARLLQKTADPQKPYSELSRLNQTPPRLQFGCSPVLWELLGAAQTAHEKTNGQFDATCEPLYQLWHIHRYPGSIPRGTPSVRAVERVKGCTGFSKLVLESNQRTASFSKPGMALTFDAVTTGTLLSRISAILQKYKIKQGRIDYGRSIMALECPASASRNYYRIRIANPEVPGRALGDIALMPGSFLAVRTAWDAGPVPGRGSDVIDPVTGRPASGTAAVAVISSSPLLAHVFATAILTGGKKTGDLLVKADPHAKILFLTPDPQQPTGFDQVGIGWQWLPPL